MVRRIIDHLPGESIIYLGDNLRDPWTKGPEIYVTVTDRGQGIAPGETEKLLRPFEQTSVKSTAGEKGAGLGPAIISRIVEGHGGRG